ncbi:ATP-binding protein [Streptomyces carminius]|uniref:ATP-binding protein n=1 Tax=Streptomyces carminius TaxID=2665496 RepID=UPI001E3B712D|nr:ATP-binding protein [Streptomyces carminius]
MRLAAFRIVQEALTNALKHAGPRTTVDLSLAADSCQIRIVVHDGGPPDDEPAPAANRPEHRSNSRLRFARYEVGIAGRRGSRPRRHGRTRRALRRHGQRRPRVGRLDRPRDPEGSHS